MTHRSLIVARLDPRHRDRVAELFAESDAGDLPHLVGVTRRTLYGFHDLYFHLVEAENDVPAKVDEVRRHELFERVNSGLAEFVQPYHPSWRGPRDAMAAPFYEWRP
jgi:cyclase